MPKLRVAALFVVLVATAAVAAPPADDAWVANIEGGWVGQAEQTPLGEMPFVMLFEREADGSLQCRTALNRDTYVTLRFWKADDGRWMLDESAGLEGQGEQSYTLAPVPTDGEARRWAVAERPGFMTIDVAIGDATLSLDVEIHGRPHASFALERLADEHVAELRAGLERQATLAPEENSIWSVLQARTPAPAEDPIEQARTDAAARPDDAKAQMQLARMLSQAIQTDPANGPRFAFELLQTLERTVQLDPTMVDAYAYLVGYYLNAPEIAGGSMIKAEQTARTLAQYDAATSEALLEQIADRRAAHQRAAGH